ncbi:unnamed protein product [Haemonchus placei]|uniref:Transposase n=1 Tax=Haemonchus placei TaxID=6290 RepID=A0A0N4XAX2_HAEPC|nr:unnamed protein product [Haemonchus placei]
MSLLWSTAVTDIAHFRTAKNTDIGRLKMSPLTHVEPATVNDGSIIPHGSDEWIARDDVFGDGTGISMHTLQALFKASRQLVIPRPQKSFNALDLTPLDSDHPQEPDQIETAASG